MAINAVKMAYAHVTVIAVTAAIAPVKRLAMTAIVVVSVEHE